MSKIIGIDLGTTNSAVSIIDGGVPKILPNFDGNRTTPSVVAFKNGDILVGQQAKNQVGVNENAIVSIKRHMGESDYNLEIEGKKYFPEEISAEILKYLKKVAEKYLDEAVTEAVITVPAYFNDDQRTATIKAGELAGLRVLRIINEPTAAAICFGEENTEYNAEDQTILVYDFGGGTFDVTILDVTDNNYEVIATNGNNHLGGDDFDAALLTWMNSKFLEKEGVDLSKEDASQARMKLEAEKAKIGLSTAESYDLNIPFISFKNGSPLNLELKITRDIFNDLIKDLVKKTGEPIKKALELGNIDMEDISSVIMNGGSSRVPLVQEFVEKYTGLKANYSLNPDEAVSIGATIFGESLSEDNGIKLADVTPMSLGIGLVENEYSIVIPQNSALPVVESRIYQTAYDNQVTVDVPIYQGENMEASDNYLLGRLVIKDLPPLPTGEAKVEVTFTLNLDGVLIVEGENLANGDIVSVEIDKGSRNMNDVHSAE
ncbi:Hsp70 family protein [Lactiplantibacillus plantarum]|uniref:Hsp70 family protein n=1 Tax=Lactiplantibacillus plantarum TaxID=1590 RepID=UPI00106D7290|nr:Hsp70 family protein [Lactiplantibacillus plantarum]MDN3985713.1 Hsp70 family protein [Lactiplantibacillus plantarum]VFI63651.1 Chaperone protein DnaK [Lactiplantibacillus plantarum]VFI64338.1 Chaperone protein DnaK [Lactiplantibacillus plantarum]